MAEWVPFKPNHAIEVMAAVVTLQEPLPQLTQRKVFKTIEDLAFGMGLRSRHLLSPQQLLTPGVVIQLGPPSAEAAPAGFLFNSMTDDPATGERTSRPSEQIEVRGNQIIYRCWDYISWAWNADRIKKLLAPFLEAAAEAVLVQGQRLEYLDRFVFDDNTALPTPDGLLRANSAAVPPQSFGTTDFWHSHTGMVVAQSDPTITRIRFVNLDVSDVTQVDDKYRSISVMTALEDRRSLEGQQPTADMLWKTFDDMHGSLKEILADIINDQMVGRIYLKDSNEHRA